MSCCLRAAVSALAIASSKSLSRSATTGYKPHTRRICRATTSLGVIATIGAVGLQAASNNAECPVNVRDNNTSADMRFASALADAVTPARIGLVSANRFGNTTSFSAASQIRAITSTACGGSIPTAVSPDNITASKPSRTAPVTSATSARVGRVLVVIDSNISVAQIEITPCVSAVRAILCCAAGTTSNGNSTPKSPRAAITPSLTAQISEIRSKACGRSILATTITLAPTNSRTCSISCGF